MKKAKQLALAVMICLLHALPSWAQKAEGTINDGNGKGIEGASVSVKNSKTGTTTDASGNFSVNAGSGDVLIISAVGYATQEVRVKENSKISIALQSQSGNLDIVVVGSRGRARVKTESPVPVDVIGLNSTAPTSARPDLTSLLNYAAPSLNFNKQSGSDGADQIDLATLRGLGPDQTLVLVNGKRRHQTAFVAIFGTRGRGNSGTDLNAIPETSIDRVEILRDGASAQYGSDAIAGVMNLILKKNTGQWQVDLGTSGYYDKKYNPHFGNLQDQYLHGGSIDGGAYSMGLNRGFSVGKQNGFLNLSGNLFNQSKTFRQVLDTNLTDKNALPINAGRRAAGNGSVSSGGIMMNLELPIAGSKVTFYSFGGVNYKASDAYAYTRSFHGYNVLSSARPNRFPTDANGNLIWDPAYMRSIPTPGDIPDTVFNPHIQTHITDASFAFGFRGTTHCGWDWDLSNSLGKNDFHYFGDGTYNASLGMAGLHKNHFDDGGFGFFQNTMNFDMNKDFKNVAQGMNLSAGAEFRYERYNIYEGEKDSYFNYDPVDDKAAGSQGFPGFQPVDAVIAKRTNEALYIQDDIDVTKEWLVSGAVRGEYYSDFGSLATFKFATRYKVSPKINIRGSVSSGFRAPSLQQINFSNTFTNVQGGNSFDVKIAPNYSPITKAAGIPKLKQEKSVNASFGFTAKPTKDLTVTVDGYMVKIKDRVVLSGQFDDSNAALQPTLDQLNVAQAQFFANAVNTTNLGLDLILNYSKKWSGQSLNVLLAGNFQHMKIDKVNVPAALSNTYTERQSFFSDREQRFVLSSAPPEKIGLTVDYSCCPKVKFGTHVTYFGEIKLLGYGYANTYPPLVAMDADPSVTVPEQFNYSGKTVMDLYASYKATKSTTFFIGADNILNTHPNLGYVTGAKLSAYDGETGGPWDAVQMGNNGIRPYIKAQFNF